MNFQDFINEGKKITLKRRYTENHPAVEVGKNARVRNKMLEAIKDGKITQEEFNNILKEFSKDTSKWTSRNAKYFNVSEDGISLSSFGKRALAAIRVNEGAICEATVEMDAMDPDNKDFLKFLKKHKVEIINKEMDGPGGGNPVITMQGKRKDLEKVLADEDYGWADPDLAEYIEESAVTENYEVIYSDGISAMKKFRTEAQAIDFMKKTIASNKKLRDIAVYKPGMYSTTQTELVVKFWGDGSYLDNVSKRDPKLAAKKLEESTIEEGRAFVAAAKKAKDEGKDEFEFDGKTYPVTIKEKENKDMKNTFVHESFNSFVENELLNVNEAVNASAYANGWAAKKYKAAGGGWRKSESVNEGDVTKKINRRGDEDGLLVKHNGEEYHIVYSGDFDMGSAVQPYGIVMPGDDTVSFLGKDKNAKQIWKQLKPKVDKFFKTNEATPEEEDEFHRNLDKLVHKTFGNESFNSFVENELLNVNEAVNASAYIKAGKLGYNDQFLGRRSLSKTLSMDLGLNPKHEFGGGDWLGFDHVALYASGGKKTGTILGDALSGKYTYDELKAAAADFLGIKESLTEAKSDVVEIDIDFAGSKADLRKLSKKHNIEADEYNPGMVMLKGDKKDILAYLQSDEYGMDMIDIKALFPELLESTVNEAKSDVVEIDIDFVGSKADLRKLSKKHNIEADEYNPGMVMLKGDKKDILAYLTSPQYDMDMRDIEDLFPELLESTVNEAFSSMKLQSILTSAGSMPKDFAKTFYQMAKVQLDKIQDVDIIEMDPEQARKEKRNNAVYLYFTTNEKPNPYAGKNSWGVTTIPGNTLLGVTDGSNEWLAAEYARSWGSKERTKSLAKTKRDAGAGFEKSAANNTWGSGISSLSKVAELADRAYVLDLDILRARYSTTAKRDERTAAKAGAIAFKSDKDFKKENLAKYHIILADRAAAMPIDAEVLKAIDVVAAQIKDGLTAGKKGKYGDVIIGEDPKGREVKLRDASNAMQNLLDDFNRYVDYTNQAKREEEAGYGDSYYTREVKNYAKSIKDRIAKIEKMDYVW